jgi:SAM-dependent methyltransferase
MAAARRSAWEEWGQVDPLWAIVTEGGKEFGGWETDEFFASGRATIESLWATASDLGLPRHHHRGLDFGCGIGRLTGPLGDRLDEVVGLDISPSMIELAATYHQGSANLAFRVHQQSDLSDFPDAHFDAVCSLLVLQHLPSHQAIVTYLREFVRVLAPGGVLLFQLPDHVPTVTQTSLRSRLRPRTRAAGALHRLGVSPTFLYHHLGWKPEMTMRGLESDRVAAITGDAGGKVVWMSDPAVDPSGVSNSFYLITR